MNQLNWKHLAYLSPAIAYGVWLTLFPIDTPLTQPDSGGYLHFSSMRTAGYPYFLWIIKWFTGDPANAIHVQLWLYVAALYVLGRTVFSTTGSVLLAVGIVLVNMINPELNKYHFILITESVFISLTIFITALLVLAIHRLNWRTIAALSSLMGLAVAVRPVGYAFLPLLFILAILLWQKIRSNLRIFLTAAILPVVGVILLEQAVYTYHHGSERNSLIGIAAFGKAGLVSGDARNPYPSTHPYHKLWQRLETDLAQPRKLIAEAPGFGGRSYLLNSYEVIIEYQFAQEEIKEAVRLTGKTPNNVMKEVGFKRLLSAPDDYFEMVVDHYRGLWTLYGASHPTTSKHLNAYLDPKRPLPLEEANEEFSKQIPSVRKATFLQPAMLALWAMTLIAMALLLLQFVQNRANPAIMSAGICALMVNGNFLLVALTGVSIPRYTIAMWPSIMVTGLYFVQASLGNAYVDFFWNWCKKKAGSASSDLE